MTYRTLLQICDVLKPDGLFLAAMLGGETLKELRASLTAAEMDISVERSTDFAFCRYPRCRNFTSTSRLRIASNRPRYYKSNLQ